MLLNFKDGAQFDYEFFRAEMYQYFDTLEYPTILIPVPSHKVGTTNSITTLVMGYKGRHTPLNCLVRSRNAASFCLGGRRTPRSIMRTIRFAKPERLAHKHILFVDDATTSGITLHTLMSLAYDYDPTSISSIALVKFI
jgi:predicted amidophosphoribosyltransferase